jgi:hypothetical protein
VAEQRHQSLGEKEKGKKEETVTEGGGGVRNGRTRQKGKGEEGENKISPPSLGKIHTKAMEKPH